MALRHLIGNRWCGYPATGTVGRFAEMTIRNGLYHIRIEMLDAVQGGNQGVMVLRDGTM